MANSFPETIREDFMQWVVINEETGCWEWNMSRSENRGGYGQKVINYKHYASHRLAWLVFRGEIEDGLFVCHKCDNPPCCNPDHLFLGTPKENQNDAWSKGRLALPTNAPRGSQVYGSALTAEQVYEIRQKFDAKHSRRQLMRDYGVSKASIYRIGNRETWKHLPEI